MIDMISLIAEMQVHGAMRALRLMEIKICFVLM